MRDLKPSSALNERPVFLLVADRTYYAALIAQINSILKYFPRGKIYLVHELNKYDLTPILPFIFKAERFKDSIWAHLPEQRGHVVKINQGKHQVEFIDEQWFMYLDTDAIVNAHFQWERPPTMRCDVRWIDPAIDKKYGPQKEEMRSFILSHNGKTEPSGPYQLFTDGAYFAKKSWIVDVLRPMIVNVSKIYLPKRWYGMEYFHIALCLLKQAAKPWKLRQALPALEPVTNPSRYDLIHFVSKHKPWQFKRGEYPFECGEIWWESFLNGKIPFSKTCNRLQRLPLKYNS